MSDRNEEDQLDEKLKAAGLYEDGMSLEEKKQYCLLVEESCTSAQNEEQQRKLHQEEDDFKHSSSSTEPYIDSEASQAVNASQDITEIQSSDERVLEKEDVDVKSSPKLSNPEELTAANTGESSKKQSNSDEDSDLSVISSSINRLSGMSNQSFSNLNCTHPSELGVKNFYRNTPVKSSSIVLNSDYKIDDLPPSSVVDKSLLEPEALEQECSQSLLDNMELGEETLPTNGTSTVSPDQDLIDNLELNENQKRPVSKLSSVVNRAKKLVGKVIPIGTSTSNEEAEEGNNDKSWKSSIRQPSRHMIEKHSKRLHEIRFQNFEDYSSLPEDQRKKIYQETLDSLSKMSIILASKNRQENVAVTWTKVIRPLPKKKEDEQSSIANTNYSLRQRRGLRPKVQPIAEIFDDDLPEVESFTSDKNDLWLPSIKPAKKRKNEGSNEQSTSKKKIPQVEHQSSDDEDFVLSKGRQNKALSDKNSGVKSNTHVGLSFDNLTKAALDFNENDRRKNNTGNKSKRKSPDNDNSDIDVVDVENPKPKCLTKTNQLPRLSSPVMRKLIYGSKSNAPGTSMASANVGTDASSSSPVIRTSISNTNLNSSVLREIPSTSGTSLDDRNIPAPPRHQSDDYIELRPAPLRVKGRKRAKMMMNSPSSSRMNERRQYDEVGVDPLASPPTSPPSSPTSSALSEHRELQQHIEERRKLQLQQRAARHAASNVNKPTPNIEAKIQCPLCQAHFPVSKIEHHASACDGETPNVVTTRQANQGRSAQQTPQQSHNIERNIPSNETHINPNTDTAKPTHTTKFDNNVTTIDPDDSDDDIFLGVRAKNVTNVCQPSTSDGGSSVAGGSRSYDNKRKYDGGRLLADSDDEDCVSIGEVVNTKVSRRVANNRN